jgi:hypothetical protein
MTLLTTAPPYLIDEIALVDVLALFLAIATVSILWHTVEKIFPDEVNDLQFFLTFIIVVVPFVTLVYFGLAVGEKKVSCNADEVLVSVVCSEGAPDGAGCSAGSTTTGVCMHK